MNKQINNIKPGLSLSENTAIIGSSGRLKKTSHGNLIDTYTDVIRFNRAPTNGYEKDVGSKTTLRIVNNHVFDNIDASKDGFTGQPQCFIRDLRDSRILYIAHDLEPWQRRRENTHEINELFLFNWVTVDKLKDKYNYPTEFHMGLGLIIVLLCVEAGIKPHLFGFDTTEKEKTRNHYWEERPGAGPCHDVGAEQGIICKLMRNDKVEVFK